jgi:ATP-dependent Lhr-like helicase
LDLTALGGRWSRTPDVVGDETRRLVLLTEVLLDRHGVLTRGAVAAENVTGGFSSVYGVLRHAEETGRFRRGYFVEGLGASQFGTAGAIDRLRLVAGREASADPVALVLAATDPANPYGAALDWPATQAFTADDTRRGHQPARKAGALVVLLDGECVLYVERGGRTVLSFTDSVDLLGAAAAALASAVRGGQLGTLHIVQADGVRVGRSELGDALQAAGFHPSPRGMQLRGRV